MLTSIITAYCAANPKNILDAAATAVICEGLAGEKAYERMLSMKGGTSTFRMCLIDEISQMTDEKIIEGKKIEIR